MNQVVIFPFEDGLAVIHPAPKSSLSLADIARKDVPQGVPYMIIPVTSLPPDRMFRSAWEADFSQPHGHGDPEGWRAEQQGEEE